VVDRLDGLAGTIVCRRARRASRIGRPRQGLSGARGRARQLCPGTLSGAEHFPAAQTGYRLSGSRRLSPYSRPRISNRCRCMRLRPYGAFEVHISGVNVTVVTRKGALQRQPPALS
jgi:hypothetical protein